MLSPRPSLPLEHLASTLWGSCFLSSLTPAHEVGFSPLPRISLTRFARSESFPHRQLSVAASAIGEVVALVACSLVLHSLLRSSVGTVGSKIVTPWWSSVLALLGLDDPSTLPLRHSSATPHFASGRSVTATTHPSAARCRPSTLSKTPLVTSCHGIALPPWPAQCLRVPHFRASPPRTLAYVGLVAISTLWLLGRGNI
jgi:hypothetical protein